jgi:hypothetical protein
MSSGDNSLIALTLHCITWSYKSVMLASRLCIRYLFCSTACSATCSCEISMRGPWVHCPASPATASPQSSRLLSNRFNETRRLIAVVSHSWNYIGKEQLPSKGWQISNVAFISVISPLYIIVNTFVYFEAHRRDGIYNSADRCHSSVRKPPSSRMFIFTFLHYPRTSKHSTPYPLGNESHSASSDHW